MLDFSTVHYLGFRHASHSLPSWERMTSGEPAALCEPPEANLLTARLAQLQGLQQALLAPSTLHLLWDLICALAHPPAVIYLDSGAYPIARWGVERAAGHGVQVRVFPHQDAHALGQLLVEHPDLSRAIVVCDGVSACCGAHAPLPDFLAQLPTGGWLVVDDTQALGIYGENPDDDNPYGRGGGGSARFHGLRDKRLVFVCSMAKGFGAPIALLSGSAELVEEFKLRSETRLHCSPPAMPEILAAMRALTLNARYGDSLRRRLARRVLRFRSILGAGGLTAIGGLFPVQTVRLPYNISPYEIQECLQQAGILAVLKRCPEHERACISFVIHANHTYAEIDRAASAVTTIVEEACYKL